MKNKIEMKEVKVGARIGRLWMIESGLDGTETIVVEGIQKVRPGTAVNPEPMTEADLWRQHLPQLNKQGGNKSCHVFS